MSDDKQALRKRIGEFEVENRALRACLEACMKSSGQHILRVEATVDARLRLSMVISVPHLSRDDEAAVAAQMAKMFAGLLNLGATAAKSISTPTDEAKP